MKTRLFVPLTLAAVVSLATFGCGGSSSPQCDVTGNWAVTIQMGAGDCNLSGTLNDTFTVTKSGANTYIIDTGVAGESTTGTVDGCKLSAITNGTGDDGNGGTYQYSVDRNYTLHGSNVTGTGSLSVTPPTCTQQFSVLSGNKS